MYKNRKIQTTVSYSKSEHPVHIKKSIPFSKTLKLKRIYSTITAFEDESAKFVERGYKADDIKEKAEHASNIPRRILLQETQNNNNISRIPLTISYNRSAPNYSQIMKKHWRILKINKILDKTEGDPTISFK